MKQSRYDSLNDCIRDWELCVANGGLRLRFATASNAISYRQRCYQARKQYAESTGNNKYGDFFIQLFQNDEVTTPNKVVKAAPAELLFWPNEYRSDEVERLSLDGSPLVEPVAEAVLDLEPDDELLQALNEAKKEVGL